MGVGSLAPGGKYQTSVDDVVALAPVPDGYALLVRIWGGLYWFRTERLDVLAEAIFPKEETL